MSRHVQLNVTYACNSTNNNALITDSYEFENFMNSEMPKEQRKRRRPKLPWTQVIAQSLRGQELEDRLGKTEIDAK